jgi:hypothetical protein
MELPVHSCVAKPHAIEMRGLAPPRPLTLHRPVAPSPGMLPSPTIAVAGGADAAVWCTAALARP